MFYIKKKIITRFFVFPIRNIKRCFFVSKQEIAYFLLYFGILIAYMGSLDPWFMWSVYKIYPVFASIPVVLSMMLSNNIHEKIFTRKDYMIPMLSYLVLVLMMALVNGRNMGGLAFLIFNACIFFSIFRLNLDGLIKIGDFLSKAMALLMCLSIPFYLLYIIGFPLPHYHITNEELQYSYENFRFFLLDDRSAWLFVPRFHSVFLEPGHLGTACSFLLLTQVGQWKKWHSIVLFITIIITFSLAAYVLLVMAILGSAWLQRKAIVGKLIAFIAILGIVAVSSIFYNKGDNLVNQLIIQRLTIDEDGKLAGDNRVTGLFETEFDNYIQSDDILFGREYKNSLFGWGNAGYRVFVYDNGIICTLLVALFYIFVAAYSPNKRGKVVMFIIAFAAFIPRSTPLAYYFFIPLYILSYIGATERAQRLQNKDL